MSQIHGIFPVLITETTYEKKDEFKSIFIDNVHKHLASDGTSSELTGNVAIHLDPAFKDFFVFVSNSVKEYISTLNIDPEIFDVNLVKSWLNIKVESDNPMHNHEDAHVSFVYYVNIPEDIKKDILFQNPHQMNDLYSNMIAINAVQYNVFNASSWKFKSTEGNSFIFPAALSHAVVGQKSPIPTVSKEQGVKDSKELLSRRIAIAGDFVLSYKDTSAKSLGLQPIKNWRTF